MKKLMIASLVMFFAFTTIHADAQMVNSNAGLWKFSIGPDFSAPIGNLKDISSFGFGGNIRGDYYFTNQVAASISLGYDNFFGKKIGSVKEKSYSIAPVFVGIKYFPAGNFYLSGEAGIAVAGIEGNSDVKFGYSPSVGYVVPAGVGGIDLGLKFTGVPAGGGGINYLTLRIAYQL